MNPIAKTAYYCCGVRAADAERRKPVCGDMFARRFMTDEGHAVFRNFLHFQHSNSLAVARARIIDDWLRACLAKDPAQQVFLIGAGFDSRAFRLGGGRWVELDQEPVIARKDALLPVSESPTELTRVAIDFGADSLAERLLPWAGTGNAVVVLEGVSQYLTQRQLAAALDTFRSTFPGHILIIDLMHEEFRLKFTDEFRGVLRTFGTDFAALHDDPESALEEAGYEVLETASLARRARQLGALTFPRHLFQEFPRLFRRGYRAYRFRARA